MKTKLGMLLLITFIAISFIIVYKEASARPMLCDTYESLCRQCNGEFIIEYCWQDIYSGLTYCRAYCYVPPGCGWLCVWPCPSEVYIDGCVL